MQKFRQTLVNIKLYLKESLTIKSVVLYLSLFIGFIYLYVTYSSILISWYDANVVSLLSTIQSNIWLQLFCATMCFVIIYDIVHKYRIRYQFGRRLSLLLFILTTILGIFRLNEQFVYLYFLWRISYVDVIIGTLFMYVLLAVINKIRFLGTLTRDTYKESSIDYLIHDNPIESIKDDIFDFKDEVDKISKSITELDKNKTWSLAILAPWGTGKTSFMNLVYEGLKKENVEILRFNPRNSTSYRNIQEDFFISLINLLSKYDFRCNRTLQKYISALKIKDDKGIIDNIINFFDAYDRGTLKESINDVFSSLKNKVIVVIDDFDRLSKEEIFEVLKLIDSNAAFKNLVFITAYDKEQVNKSLGEIFKTTDSCYVDKFFNLEYFIPFRPYMYILRFIWKNLCKFLRIDDEEQKEVINIVNNNSQIFKKYIVTIRDAKRYINQVLIDYKHIQGDVIIEEFLLLQLIKYKYPILYKKLYNKEDYLESSNVIYSEKYFYVKENLNAPEDFIYILKILFPQNRIEKIYMHIADSKSFDNYFVNHTYNYIRIGQMQSLFNTEWVDIKITISDWVKQNIYGDLINYLRNLDVDNFRDIEKYFKYSQMVTLLACLRPYTPAYYMFLNLLNEERIMEYRLEVKDYKTKLLDIIKEYDKNYVVLGRIHYSYKTENLDEKDILHDDEIWPEIKSEFLKAAEKNDVNEKDLLEWLYKCVDKNNTLDKTPKLDIECIKAYRSRIEQDPSFYINNFVFLERYSSLVEINGVACENYWRQIFGDEKKFETFLVKCADKGIKNYDRVSNFWELYKANDYKTIQFNMQGNVQEKINNNFIEEMKLYKDIKDIEEKVASIPAQSNDMSEEEINIYKERLVELKKQLRVIKLKISLKDKVENDIFSKNY